MPLTSPLLGLPTPLLSDHLPNFKPNLILATRLARVDERDEITQIFLDDSELQSYPAISASSASAASSVYASLNSINASDASNPASEPRLRIVVAKQDAVIESTSLAIHGSLVPITHLTLEQLLSNDEIEAPHLAHALPPPPSASQLIPLGNQGPVRALKLSPRVINSPEFLAILRSPKSVELFEVGALDGEPPKRVQEITRDRRNAEGIVGIEWTGPGDILVVGSNGVEGWRFDAKTGQFVLRRSQQVAVSWWVSSEGETRRCFKRRWPLYSLD
jgi:hypothetical protein